MLAGLKNWISGIVLALIALSGLFMAAGGGTGDSYVFGLIVAAVALIALAKLVHGLAHEVPKGPTH
jgi:hypothetical protein